MVAGIPGDVAWEIDQCHGLPGELEVAATAQPGLTAASRQCEDEVSSRLSTTRYSDDSKFRCPH